MPTSLTTWKELAEALVSHVETVEPGREDRAQAFEVFEQEFAKARAWLDEQTTDPWYHGEDNCPACFAPPNAEHFSWCAFSWCEDEAGVEGD